MTRTHGSSGRPAAAPRHLTRRRFRPDIPDAKFVSQSSAEAVPHGISPKADRAVKAPRQAAAPRHKRMVALAVVIVVTAAVPALILALVFFS